MTAAAIQPKTGYGSDPFTKGVGKVLNNANAIKNDSQALFDTLKVGYYGLMGVQAIGAAAEPSLLLMQKIAGSCSVIDFFDVFSNVNYFASGAVVDDAKDKRICKIAGMSLLTAGATGGAGLWLAELGFLSLGEVAKTIGTTVCGAVGVGYAFMAGDAIRDIVVAKNCTQRAKGIVDLISRIASVALAILFMIPGINVWAFVALGLVAKGLAVVSFLIKYSNPNAFKVQEKPA